MYISSVCSQDKFDELVSQGKIISQFQNQKFHNLFLTGLRLISNDDITVISYYPILRQFRREVYHEEEVINNILYIYPRLLDLPIVHHFSKIIQTYKYIKKHRVKNMLLVCNIMNFDECIAALFIRLIYGNKVAAIVADVPGKTSGANHKGEYWKRLLRSVIYPLYTLLNKKYDAYIFLTEAMNNVVNINKKPYLVVEGLADLEMQCKINDIKYKNTPKVIMYAGGVHREYGVQMLVEAFEKANHTGWELHIYGEGNYEDDLKIKVKSNHSIRYFGVRENSEIVSLQLKATLLVNPRPTHEEFVKYSFPSKILECMASGTPLLTTKLPGMPEEYLEYVYLLPSESIEGYTKILNDIFLMNCENLHKFGLAAKDFVIQEKNNIKQTRKVYKFLQNVFE